MHENSVLVESFGCGLPQTRRGHERRLSLLMSATELFLTHGYDAVSLDDIVQHAGGSKTSIYKYFGNKEGLFVAICDYHREQFFKGICVSYDPSQDNLKDYLVYTLVNCYRHIHDPNHVKFMRLVIEQSQRSSELAIYLHEKGPKFIQCTIANALLRAEQQGKIYCPSPLSSAMMYFGILRNYEWQMIMGLDIHESEQEVNNYIEYCVERFLEGHQKV